MKTFPVLFFSIIGLAVAFAPAAQAKSSKHKKSMAAHSMKHHQGAVVAAGGFQGGVLAGPLYNGQDYIGDDPDPNIRAYLLKDMSRYHGGR